MSRKLAALVEIAVVVSVAGVCCAVIHIRDRDWVILPWEVYDLGEPKYANSLKRKKSDEAA